MRFKGSRCSQQGKDVKMFLVTYYKDDSDAVPCQDIMTAECFAAMDDHKIAKAEEIKSIEFCIYPDCVCPFEISNGFCLLGLPQP